MRSTREAPGCAWTWQAALRLCVIVALCLLALGLSFRATEPPAPLTRDAAPEQLSAERAAETLDLVLGVGPHPVSSDRNREVRDRILRELRRLGYAPRQQHALSCRPGVCAEVDNLFVIIPGSDPSGGSILLASHYDSVPAAQGAADDGIGSASLLALARALRHRAPTRQRLVLLFSDGEEAGLLGMRAFTRHEDFRDVRYVVNLEARGNRGPMLLFETGTGDAPLVAAYAGHARHPLTSSLFQSIYRRLPNDTDFSVALRERRRGLNFACIEGVEHYHTSHDDLEHLDRGTLQHGLDNLDAALAGIDAVAGSPEAGPIAAEPNYFDLLGGPVVFLPRWLGYWATLFGLLGPCLIAAWQRRRVRWRSLFATLGYVAVGLLVSTACCVGLQSLLHYTGRVPAPWVAHADWILVTGAGLGLTWLLWQAGVNRGSPGLTNLEQSISSGICFGLLAVTLLGLLPGAAYLAYLPSLGLALLSLASALLELSQRRRSHRGLQWMVWGLGACLNFCVAILWLPVLIQLYAALGLIALPAFGALWLFWGLSWLALMPAQSRRLLPWTLAILVVCVGVSLLQTPYSPEVPQRASVGVTYDVTSRRGRVLVDTSHGPVPEKLAKLLEIDRWGEPSFPWLGGWLDQTASGPSDWHSPIRSGLRLVRREAFPDGVRYEFDLRRQVWTEAVSLNLPQGSSVELSFELSSGESRVAEPRLVRGSLGAAQSAPSGWQRWLYLGSSRQPLRVQLKTASLSKLTLLVCEHRFELPDEWARRVEALRPSNAVASQFGDNTAICHTETF
ncbi:MAG: M28 family peptidase [Myxococcales bacterium]|nr:M28 family peptidase [Myxococcales bacterium]